LCLHSLCNDGGSVVAIAVVGIVVGVVGDDGVDDAIAIVAVGMFGRCRSCPYPSSIVHWDKHGHNIVVVVAAAVVVGLAKRADLPPAYSYSALRCCYCCCWCSCCSSYRR